MNIILNELPDNKKKLWIYDEEPELFSKYSQIHHVIPNVILNEIPKVIPNEIPNEILNEKPNEILNEKPNEILNEIPNEIPKVIPNEIPNEIPKVIPNEKFKEINNKRNNEKPMEIIIKHTLSRESMRNEIYSRLVLFISAPEFSKAFGVKKSAEIIGALSNNRWNQSMALFISFLLDANVIYKDKSYLFNKNKNNMEISVM